MLEVPHRQAKERDMKTRRSAVISGSALIATVFVMGLTTTPERTVAGSGNAAVNTFEQPAPPAMSLGATALPAPAATAPATSLATPTAKATPLPAECSMPGKCP
jgi:C4-dicarboxylate transporter